MTSIFEGASFGTMCETRDGGKAVYIGWNRMDNLHKIIVQGFEFPIMYFPDGRRKSGGRYVSKHGPALDIIKTF